MSKFKVWCGVGDHPTPQTMAESFAQEFVQQSALNRLFHKRRQLDVIRIGDFFSGDGRLGNQVANLIQSIFDVEVRVTYVESNEKNAKKVKPFNRYSKVLVKDIFHEKFNRKFDVVVANPPFLNLDKATSEKFSLNWDEVRQGGRNLYGMAMLRCLNACIEGGVVGLISPFGWTRGVVAHELRRELVAKSQNIVIHALPQRSLFPNVHQDIAYQFLTKRDISNAEPKPTRACFGINGHPFSRLSLPLRSQKHEFEGIRVRVGPLVWNRTSLKFTASSKKAMFVVNGGNIGHNGKLRHSIPEYEARQFVSIANLKQREISKAPLLLLRRTLRGKPGDWKIDYCIRFSRFRCMAENHVIAIEFPKTIKLAALQSLTKTVCFQIKKLHEVSGTPNLTTGIVKNALNLALRGVPAKPLKIVR